MVCKKEPSFGQIDSLFSEGSYCLYSEVEQYH